MAEVESVQYFQFDQQGNMYVFAPGAGCTGESKLVRPGDEMIFSNSINFGEHSNSSSVPVPVVKSTCDSLTHSESLPSQRSFHNPLKLEVLEELSRKNLHRTP